jgi:hypothetical protein
MRFSPQGPTTSAHKVLPCRTTVEAAGFNPAKKGQKRTGLQPRQFLSIPQNPGCGLKNCSAVLYQGMTSVVPQHPKIKRALAPEAFRSHQVIC